jgi:hypothetical protein
MTLKVENWEGGSAQAGRHCTRHARKTLAADLFRQLDRIDLRRRIHGFFMDDPGHVWSGMQTIREGAPAMLPQRPKAILIVSRHWRPKASP